MRADPKFITWLSQELSEREWSNADLARHSGVSEGQLSHIFSGTRGVGDRTLEKIARALNLPKAELLRRAGLLPEPPRHDPLLAEIIHLFDRLDPEKKQLARSMLRALSAGKARSRK